MTNDRNFKDLLSFNKRSMFCVGNVYLDLFTTLLIIITGSDIKFFLWMSYFIGAGFAEPNTNYSEESPQLSL